MIATDNLIKIKNHNFERFTSFESIQSQAWRLGCVCGGNPIDEEITTLSILNVTNSGTHLT